MTKVECLKRILAKLSKKNVSEITGSTVCDILHQIGDCHLVAETKFVVTVTATPDTEHEGQYIYSADKTLEQIITAHNNGEVIECHYGEFALHPLMIGTSVCSFSCEVMSTSTIAERTTINITSSAVGVTTLRHTLTPAA